LYNKLISKEKIADEKGKREKKEKRGTAKKE
jgi:hypothetical protein